MSRTVTAIELSDDGTLKLVSVKTVGFILGATVSKEFFDCPICGIKGSFTDIIRFVSRFRMSPYLFTLCKNDPHVLSESGGKKCPARFNPFSWLLDSDCSCGYSHKQRYYQGPIFFIKCLPDDKEIDFDDPEQCLIHDNPVDCTEDDIAFIRKELVAIKDKKETQKLDQTMKYILGLCVLTGVFAAVWYWKH